MGEAAANWKITFERFMTQKRVFESYQNDDNADGL